MIIKQHKKPFPHLIVENVFDKNELKSIWHEIIFLQNKLVSPEETRAASVKVASELHFGLQIREFLKKANGIFLTDAYAKEEISDILRISRKLFNDEIKNACKNTDLILEQLNHTNYDGTLLNYYGDSEYYHAHRDDSIITIICVLHKTPKSYKGGELYFENYDYSVNLENNQCIYFPSFLRHEVKEVRLKNNKNFNGRFSITKFVGTR